MAHLIDNSFSSYHLTDEEAIQGSLLTTTQKQVIQNQIAEFAEQKMRIRFDPNNPVEFAQQEAEKKGAIEALQFLLTSSIAAEEVITYNSDLSNLVKTATLSSEQSVTNIFEPQQEPSNINPRL